MTTPDFIRIGGEAIRLTSMARDGEAMTLVVMMRGSRDHERLVELLRQSPVAVALPDEEARSMAVAGDRTTSTGEGSRTIYRHVVELRPASDMPVAVEEAREEQTLERRLARIEEKLDRVLSLLERNAAPE